MWPFKTKGVRLKSNQERYPPGTDPEWLRNHVNWQAMDDGHLRQADMQHDGSWIVTDYGEA